MSYLSTSGEKSEEEDTNASRASVQELGQADQIQIRRRPLLAIQQCALFSCLLAYIPLEIVTHIVQYRVYRYLLGIKIIIYNCY